MTRDLPVLTVLRESRAADVERFFRGEAPQEVVKKNSARTVLRVTAGEPALYVKRFPRSLFRDRARKEARLLQELAEAGIPCPRLVATARDDSGSYLITEEVPNARILKAVIAGGGHDVRRLLASLADLTRRMHDAGFDHQDFHVGNILVGDGEALYVLDVHRARRARALSRARRMDAIAFAALSFFDIVPLTEVVRFVRRCGMRSRREVEETLDRMARFRDRHDRSRQERCVKESTAFGVRDGVYYRKGTDLEAVRAALESAGPVVKETGGERLSRLPSGWFVKRSGRALRYWKNAHGLMVRGIATPRLHACGKTWVVGDWVDALNLGDHVKARFGAMGRPERDDFLFRLARTVRRMHARGVFHQDLKAANVLVTPRDFLFVDLDRVKFFSTVPLQKRLFNLAQLNASVTAPLTRTDRLRFFRGYIGRDRTLWLRRKALVGQVMKITVARRHKWPPR